MIETIRNVHARTLCKLASEEASSLHYPLPDHVFGFVAQQSAEKAMKALITIHDKDYPRTHDLERLAELLRTCSEPMPSLPFDLKHLQPYAVELRYDDGVPLSSEQRTQVQAAIETLNQHVLTRILEVEAAQPYQPLS